MREGHPGDRAGAILLASCLIERLQIEGRSGWLASIGAVHCVVDVRIPPVGDRLIWLEKKHPNKYMYIRKE